MRSVVTSGHWLIGGLAWALVFTLVARGAPGVAEKAQEPTPAEKTRKALEETISAEFSDQSLTTALQDLGDKAKVKFVVDEGMNAQMAALGLGIGKSEPMVTAKFEKVKLRTALKQLLGQHGLSYAILGDTVLVATEENASYRQVRQQVSLDLDGVPFDAALKRLAKETAVNLVLDPRLAKEARTASMTMQLDDVPLENAVRLLAELADLKAVRVGNVLFVTTEARAAKMRKDKESTPPTGNMNGLLGGLAGIGGIGMPGLAAPIGVPAVEEVEDPPTEKKAEPADKKDDKPKEEKK